MGQSVTPVRMTRMLLIVLVVTVFAAKVELAAIEDPFICPSDGIHANPENCQCFYICANGEAFPDCCGHGAMFDIDMGGCNYAENVDCGDRPIPETTTPPPTEPTEPTETTPTEPTEPTTHYTGPSTTEPGPIPGLPKLVLGMYVLLADDTDDFFTTDADWEPMLHPYQQIGANVLFFTFVNPVNMTVPRAFGKLAATRGTDAEGAVPADTKIIFAIGGYAYSLDPDPWDWLTTQAKAEAMAEQVAKWKDDYNVDGIDLDIEEGAGDHKEAGANLVHFIRKLKSLQPDLIVSQPTYGWPQVRAEIDVINASWNKDGSNNGLADSVGIMVYEGAQSLQYVENFADGTNQGGPIHCNVPKNQILVGAKGAAKSTAISKLAEASVKRELLGIMVWYCSIKNGPVYEPDWDCTNYQDSIDGYIAAMKYFNDHM